MKSTMFLISLMVFFNTIGEVLTPDQSSEFIVAERNNDIFTQDLIWRGADGAASIDLRNGRVLWLFSDTFIDTQAQKLRKQATMIRNSIGIQEGYSLENAKMSFYFQGNLPHPQSFFAHPGDSWFWTGHGTLVGEQLVVFLIEEQSTTAGLGFEAIGWYVALIQNPNDPPPDWDITYIKGVDTKQLIVGSSAVFIDGDFLYAYAVAEPATHEVYLARFPVTRLMAGDVSEIEWWNNIVWGENLPSANTTAPLFIGQTEFSVHFNPLLSQYIQIQTYGFGAASLGYRKASTLQGPWSDPIMFYQPKHDFNNKMVYTANAHPEFGSQDGILVTYNVNNNNFEKLLEDESIYFPKTIKLKILK